MSFSKQLHRTNDASLSSAAGKAPALNPNAAEFVPFSLRSPSGITGTADVSARVSTSGTLGKAVLDRSESSVSFNSDEEARQYWNQQLPDDITPDFNVIGEDESQGFENHNLVGLSLQDGSGASRFTHSGGGYLSNQQVDLSSQYPNGNNYTEKMQYLLSPSKSSALNVSAKPWDQQSFKNDLITGNAREGNAYNGNPRHEFLSDMLNETNAVEQSEITSIDFLASQFPGFAAESLAEVYFASQCDLNLTIEMLTQLELQVDVGLYSSLSPSPKTLSTPDLSTMDFPALPVPDGQNAMHKYASVDLQQSGNSHRSSVKDMLAFKSRSSVPSRGAADYASIVKKLASQNPDILKYGRNGSAEGSNGSIRSASLYSSAQGKSIYGERMHSRGSSQAAPAWLDTGEAVANLYSELREEARNQARLRNVYFEQARQAYLVGNKALAKELSAKGQIYNATMKAAHEQAQDSIFRQRNPSGSGRGRERMIDLHGLHVNEAIVILKNELSVLRTTARSSDHRLQVYICVGTGHHTRGTRTPARLPAAIQRYLLEEEGLDYTEPQPGLLRVVVH